ncbi:MAG TPA: HD domain-containing protein, partial [Patescibacteria group bacterium]|nr:HD domain-containing protein [Patescibacteria group bacterium]
MTFEVLEKKIAYLSEPDQKLVRRAFEFAEKVHRSQKRHTGEPFISHGLETAGFIAELKMDATALAAALLHDTCEDTDCELSHIRRHFGKKIAALVDGVTKLGKIRIRRRWLILRDEKELQEFDRQVETLRKMFLAMARDIRIVLIKLADRLHNMKTLAGVPEEKRLRIAKETLEIYAPLSDRLGMGELKGQLEDLAFAHIYPQEFQELKSRVSPLLKDKERYLNRLQKIILKKLGQQGLRAEVNGRKKHLYSLFLKLKRYDNDLSRIYDLVALRIIVYSVSDCYKALGLIHEIWRPLLGKIKDYIAMPKPNGYQSLHTTVFAEGGELIEIQIRTKAMHDQAE